MYDPLDEHHIFPGKNRELSDKYGLVVRLCHSRCHETGRMAAHRNRDTRAKLERYGQEKAMREQGWTVDEFVAVFGRNYCD